MTVKLVTALLILSCAAAPAVAQSTDTNSGATTTPPPSGAPITGAVDAPKTTTSGNERATSDAAGVPQGTVGAGDAGTASPGSDTNATAATARKHHHHRAKAAPPPQ